MHRESWQRRRGDSSQQLACMGCKTAPLATGSMPRTAVLQQAASMLARFCHLLQCQAAAQRLTLRASQRGACRPSVAVAATRMLRASAHRQWSHLAGVMGLLCTCASSRFAARECLLRADGQLGVLHPPRAKEGRHQRLSRQQARVEGVPVGLDPACGQGQPDSSCGRWAEAQAGSPSPAPPHSQDYAECRPGAANDQELSLCTAGHSKNSGVGPGRAEGARRGSCMCWRCVIPLPLPARSVHGDRRAHFAGRSSPKPGGTSPDVHAAEPVAPLVPAAVLPARLLRPLSAGEQAAAGVTQGYSSQRASLAARCCAELCGDGRGTGRRRAMARPLPALPALPVGRRAALLPNNGVAVSDQRAWSRGRAAALVLLLQIVS